MLINKPQNRAISETKAIFGPLRERIAAAVERVEGMLVSFLFPRFWAFVCCAVFFFFFSGPGGFFWTDAEVRDDGWRWIAKGADTVCVLGEWSRRGE